MKNYFFGGCCLFVNFVQMGVDIGITLLLKQRIQNENKKKHKKIDLKFVLSLLSPLLK